MKVVISGASKGIGKATVQLFLAQGYEVVGIDVLPSDVRSDNYTHFIADISKPDTLPSIEGVGILINNAGVQDSADDIVVNLKGSMNVTERYAFQKDIHSVLFIASASAHTGAEFPAYSASKGGILAYMKNVALRLVPYGATCNSLSPGGVTTELNRPVMEDPKLWKQIMDVTPLKKWASAHEIAQWCFFMTAVNTSCTGQDILIDNGEKDLNSSFVWV